MKRLILLALIPFAIAQTPAPPTRVVSWTAPLYTKGGAPIEGPITYNVYGGPSGGETLMVSATKLLTATVVAQCVQVSSLNQPMGWPAVLESDRTKEICDVTPVAAPVKKAKPKGGT